jgi:glycosyltransferase involved in cell wall biosynthesis
MTGGPIQLIGGGFGSENVLLRRLGRPSRLREALLFHVVRQFDRIIVRGSGAHSFVRKNKLNKQCSIMTGSVDVERFRPNNAQRDIDVVCVARLVPYKGVEECVEVLAAVAREKPTLRAVVVGAGPLQAKLIARTLERGIEECVKFLGKVDHVEEILRRSQVFLLVSPSEGMSIAMLEAMASGVPVIVNDVGDLHDMVSPGRTGVLLESTAPTEAAQRIIDLLENSKLRSKMSEAARAAVVERCSVDAVARCWEDIFGDEPSNECLVGQDIGGGEVLQSAR